MIHLYEGTGRGKTSIAIGTAIRMVGSGMEVLFTQFMKGNETGEIGVLEGLPGVTILRGDREYPFYNNMTQQDKLDITACHNHILEMIIEKVSTYRLDTKQLGGEVMEPRCLVVLDEITYPVQFGLVDERLLTRLFAELPPCVDLIMTGRGPSEEMKQVSDYWTELEMKKHPFEHGVSARKGIEF